MALMADRQPEDLIGRGIDDFEPLASYGQAQELLRSVLDAGRVYVDLEIEGRSHSTGESRIFLANIFSLRADDATVEGAGVGLNDITERKRFQEELALAKHAAEEANRCQSQSIA